MENKLQKITGQSLKTSQIVLQAKYSENYISNLSNKDCAELITKILQLVGATEKNIPESMQFITEQFKKVYHKWTVEEIMFAIMLGIEGKLEKVDMNLYDKPFNLVYVSNILNKYRIQIKAPVMISHNKSMLPSTEVEKTLSEEEKRELSIKNAVSLYQRFMDGKIITDYGGAVHKNLSRIKLINWNKDEITELYQRTLEIYQEKQDAKLLTADSIHKKVIYENIANIMDPSKSEKYEQNMIYRELSLQRFFCILKDTEISTDDFKEMVEERI